MKIFKTGAFDDEAVDTSQATPFREFAPPKFTKKVLVALTVKGMQASGPFGQKNMIERPYTVEHLSFYTHIRSVAKRSFDFQCILIILKTVKRSEKL